ncbi:MAG: hypothetical protein ACNA8K_03335 [Cyclonatronaceae bacterium]
MYKDVLSRMEGVDLFPLISLFIFLTFFVLLIMWVIRLNRGYIDTMANMPLEDDESSGKGLFAAARPDGHFTGKNETDMEQQNNRKPE